MLLHMYVIVFADLKLKQGDYVIPARPWWQFWKQSNKAQQKSKHSDTAQQLTDISERDPEGE